MHRCRARLNSDPVIDGMRRMWVARGFGSSGTIGRTLRFWPSTKNTWLMRPASNGASLTRTRFFVPEIQTKKSECCWDRSRNLHQSIAVDWLLTAARSEPPVPTIWIVSIARAFVSLMIITNLRINYQAYGFGLKRLFIELSFSYRMICLFMKLDQN